MEPQPRAAIMSLVGRLLDGEQIHLDELDQLQVSLRQKLDLPVEPRVAELTMIFDLLRAMSLLDESDPALAWNRGSLLADYGRHTEAADAKLDAFARIREGLQRGDELNDGEDWAEAALYHACRNLILAGQPLSAAILSRRLTDEEYLLKVREMLKQPMGGPIGGQAQ